MAAERNSGGLAALTQAEIASHEFAAARDHALQLKELEPGIKLPVPNAWRCAA
ncbi:MAG: hypothetical protein WKF84_27970 [Pyrinomonadaceae bacterium]